MQTGGQFVGRFPLLSFEIKRVPFSPICSAFKRHTGGSQPITAHTTSKWRQWKPSTQISKQVLALYVRFFFLPFFFKRTTAKMIALNSNYTICSFLCPESAADIMWKIRQALPYTCQVKLDSLMKYRIFEFLKRSLSKIFYLDSYWFQYKSWTRDPDRHLENIIVALTPPDFYCISN